MLVNTSSQWVWVSGNGGYNGNGQNNYHEHYDDPHGGGGGTYNHEDEIILETSFLNNDKVNCTYQQLLENTTISQLLSNFLGNDSGIVLTFDLVEDLQCADANDPNGCTQNNLEIDNSITILIDQDYINNTQTPTLFIARTIIHEAIHANLYLALFNHNNGNTVNLPNIDDLPSIYEQYRQLRGWQHEFMASEYINLIAQTLQDVHLLLNDQTFINSISNDYPDMSLQQFYTSIAYLGLEGTVGYTNYLIDPINNTNFSISYEAAKSDSTKTPNCN